MKSSAEPSWELSPVFLQRPRTLGPAWTRIVRGDRGCLYDAISLAGALVTGGLAMVSALEWLPFEWVYAGVAMWGGGFVLGTRNQMRSSQERRLQLSEAPVVAVAVLEAGPELLEPPETRKTGRALVLYAEKEGQERDCSALLTALGRVLEISKAGGAKAPKLASQLQGLRDDPFCFDHLALDPQEIGQDGYVLTRMVIYEERLAPEVLRPSSIFWGIARSEQNFIEQIPFSEAAKVSPEAAPVE